MKKKLFSFFLICFLIIFAIHSISISASSESIPKKLSPVQIFEKTNPSVVVIWIKLPRPENENRFYFASIGGGVIYNKDGRIMTLRHVINPLILKERFPNLSEEEFKKFLKEAEAKKQIWIEVLNQKALLAIPLWEDPVTDEAIIKIINPPAELIPVELGDSENLKVGEEVFSIGNPLNHERYIFHGLISGLHQIVGLMEKEDLVALDMSANPGMSGGPLINSNGQIIGLIAARENFTIGYAVPINQIKNTMKNFLNSGEAHHGWIGAKMVNFKSEDILNQERIKIYLQAEKKQISLPQQDGLLITGVEKESPSQDKLFAGDLVLEIKADGKKIIDAPEFYKTLDEISYGDSIELKILRDEKIFTIIIEVEPHPLLKNNPVFSIN